MIIKRRKTIVLILISLLSIIAFSASTTYVRNVQAKNEPISIEIDGTIPKYTVNELSGLSDLIIEGKVINISSGKWNTIDGKKPEKLKMGDMIYKEVNVKVSNVLKGTLTGDQIKVFTYEGIDEDGFKITSDCEAKFSDGQNVLLFLLKDNTIYNKNKKDEHYIVAGMYQGKYVIENESAINNNAADIKNITLKDMRTQIKNNLNTKVQGIKGK